MSDKRRIYEKYQGYNGVFAAATFLKIHTPVTLGPLIQWLEDHLGQYETISIEEWIGDLYYIEVKDDRPGFVYPEDIRLAFTVDVRRDRIFWSLPDKNYPYFPRGGNCLVRTNKWKGLLIKRYGPTIRADGRVRWYSNVYPDQEVCVE